MVFVQQANVSVPVPDARHYPAGHNISSHGERFYTEHFSAFGGAISIPGGTRITNHVRTGAGQSPRIMLEAPNTLHQTEFFSILIGVH